MQFTVATSIEKVLITGFNGVQDSANRNTTMSIDLNSLSVVCLFSAGSHQCAVAHYGHRGNLNKHPPDKSDHSNLKIGIKIL